MSELDPDLLELRRVLSAKIRQARESRGITQGQLAHQMEAPRSIVNRLERGTRDKDVMTVSSLFRVAQALGMKLKIEFIEEWDV
tara:strand:- start:824 stop:1075 length:252 start_codon:yes stop_codon:yes gene_type:complete